MSLLNGSCGGNFFEGMSGKTSHAAVIEEVRNLVNDLEFSEAVDVIEANTDLVITDRGDMMLFASAYAGDCGLTFAEIFDSLATATGSPMNFMMSAFTTKAVVPDHCYQAQLWIERIGAAGVRTTNENIAMFLIGMAKIGTYLRNRADADRDGTVDGTFDSCDNTDLPRDEVKQVVSGFGLLIENVAALGTNISGSLSGSVTSINAVCVGLGLTCNVTDPTAISDGDADSFRDAIKSSSTTMIGIETCDPLTTLCCP